MGAALKCQIQSILDNAKHKGPQLKNRELSPRAGRVLQRLKTTPATVEELAAREGCGTWEIASSLTTLLRRDLIQLQPDKKWSIK